MNKQHLFFIFRRLPGYIATTIALVYLCSRASGKGDEGGNTLNPTALDLVNTQATNARYRNRDAVRLEPTPGKENADETMLAILSKSDFGDGTIEIDVAGAPRKEADPKMRGFIGIAFRVSDNGNSSEVMYLRTANGRADDQVVRNHSVQYVSIPDYGWRRLREESPGKYEAYADLEAGAWTHVKIVVQGATAKLFINGASQPCLIVSDLKHGISRGQIGLWSHTTTEGYFANLRVNSAP